MDFQPKAKKAGGALLAGLATAAYEYYFGGPWCYDCGGQAQHTIALRFAIASFLLAGILVYLLWSIFENRQEDRKSLLFYALAVAGSIIVSLVVSFLAAILLLTALKIGF